MRVVASGNILETKMLFLIVLLTVLSLAPLTIAVDNGTDSTPSPDGVLADHAIIT